MSETATPEAEARVTFTRTSADDVGQRQVLARIDDGKQVTLLHGQSATVGVTAGEHQLKANNTLVWRTVRFTIDPGEHVTFLLVNRASRWTLGFLALMGVAPLNLTIERVETP